MAGLLGAAACLTLELFSGPILSLVGGQDMQASENSVLLGGAADYLAIRALGMPAVLLSTAAGGAFRGLLDTRTPLGVAVGCNLLNLALGALRGGVAG